MNVATSVGTLLALMRSRLIELRRDRVALLLVFVLPIVFFTIFAAIFGDRGGSTPRATRVLIVDEDRSDASRGLVDALDGQVALDVHLREGDGESAWTRESALRAVQLGRASAAIVVPSGFDAGFASFAPAPDDHAEPAPGGVLLIADDANPIVRGQVEGILQAAAFRAAPDRMFDRGVAALERFGEPLTPKQDRAAETVRTLLRTGGALANATGDAGTADGVPGLRSPAAGGGGRLIPIRHVGAQRVGRRSSLDLTSYYASGIGVMFLLFSMAGAAGVLLDERERGTLERLLSAGVPMTTILASSWIFFVIIGVAQLATMFLWGALVFGVSIWDVGTLAGLLVMGIATAAASAAFGMFLATMCRSRAQLAGMSTVLILVMSALGGSMIPKFAMPAFMDLTSRFTINGWALEGFLSVLWYRADDAGAIDVLASIALPLGVLAGLTVVFLGCARLFARAWETV